LQSRRYKALETVIDPEADGLAAWFLRAVPSTTTHMPDAEHCGGQYVIVAGGTLLLGGIELSRLSCAYVSADTGPMVLQAGGDGLEALIVHFPVAEAYVSGKARA
jgi:hypothetical protein